MNKIVYFFGFGKMFLNDLMTNDLMTDQQGRYTRQADALQAKIERCKTGQKGEMQDRPKERDTGHAKSERCSTGQKRELQDRPK